MAIPIVIGVTGHRNIAPGDAERLRGIAHTFFTGLQARYPHTPIEVLSSLAAGADMVCARAALDAGCTLSVPLPMERADYESDFSEEEKHEFDSLLQLAAGHFVAPHVEPKRGDRGFYYRQAGIYIAEHAHLLLALWDGEVKLTPEGGGTYETVDLMRKGSHRKRGMLVRENGLVLQIVTPRAGQATPEGAFRSFLYTDEKREVMPGEDVHIPAFSHIESFNIDAEKQAERITQKSADIKAQVISPADEAHLGHNETNMLHTFSAADAMALRFQQQRIIILRVLSILALALVISFLLYDEMESPYMLIAYGMFLLAAFMAYLVSRTKRYHEKYMLYRVLSETLRVQFYMQVGGHDYDFFIPQWRKTGELDFIEKAALAYRRPGVTVPGAQQILEEYWVRGQLAYHMSSKRKKGKQHSFNQNAEKVLLIAAILFFAVVAVYEYAFPAQMEAGVLNVAGQPFTRADTITLSSVFKIILGTIFAGSAFLSNYYGKLSLSEQINDDGKMAKLFQAAQDALRGTQQSSNEMSSLLAELAEAEISENINWYIFNRGNAPEFIID